MFGAKGFCLVADEYLPGIRAGHHIPRIPDWRVMGSNAARLTPEGWLGLEESEGSMPYSVEIRSICVEIASIFTDAQEYLYLGVWHCSCLGIATMQFSHPNRTPEPWGDQGGDYLGGDHSGGEVLGASSFRVGGRLNLLLSTAPWRPDAWAETLPRLLGPLGVSSIRATSARGAEHVIRSIPVHIAVVDMALPLEEDGQDEAGARVLELLSRLHQAPPTVVIKTPARVRDEHRHMQAALRCNAFAVLDRGSADHERILQVMQRVLARHYQDRWPGQDRTPGG